MSADNRLWLGILDDDGAQNGKRSGQKAQVVKHADVYFLRSVSASLSHTDTGTAGQGQREWFAFL